MFLFLTCVVLATTGRADKNQPVWSRGFTPGKTLQAAVDVAISKGVPASVDVQAGDYSFGEAAFVIANAHNILIAGAGIDVSSLWFSPGYGLEFINCTNVTFVGFSSDTLTSPFSQATLVSVGPGGTCGSRSTGATIKCGASIVIDVEEGFPLPVDTDGGSVLFNQTCPDGGGICGEIKTIYWDPKSRRMWPGQPMGNPLGGGSVCNAVTRRCTMNLVPAAVWTPPAGSLVTMSPRAWASKFPIPTYYKGSTFVLNSSKVTLQDYTIHSAGDMTYLETLGDGGHVYNNCNIRRRESPPYSARLLASNSDGFHSFAVGTGGTLENSEFEFIADDYMNFHNRELLLAKPLFAGDLHATIVDPGDVLGHSAHPGEDWAKHPRSIAHTSSSIRAGDLLKLYSTNVSEKGTYPLLATVEVAGMQQLDAATMPPLPATLAGRIEPDAPTVWLVDLAAALAGVSIETGYGAFVQVDRLASFNGMVRGNTFHDGYNNLGRLAATGLTLENNVFYNSECGIHVSYDIIPGFLEGSLGMHGITLRNNTFRSVHGCPGNPHADANGCPNVCTGMPCILQHVDPALRGILSLENNVVAKT